METLIQDVRYGVRMLIKNPGFTLVAVLSLALGIGANSAIFSVLNATLLRQRTYPKDPDRVHMLLVMDMNAKKKLYWGSPQTLSNYLYWRNHNQVFEQLAAHVEENFNLMGGERPVHIPGEYVSANFFPLMGVQAMLGRTFLAEENQSKSANVVV